MGELNNLGFFDAIVRLPLSADVAKEKQLLSLGRAREDSFFRRVVPPVNLGPANAPKSWFDEQLTRCRLVDWNEDDPYWHEQLVLKASTFHPPLLFPEVPPAKYGTDSENSMLVSPDGKFGYSNRVLPRGHHLAYHQGKRRGKAYFDGDVTIPVLFDAEHPMDVWMSITPQEVLTMRQGVRYAKGKVVVGGLGLGWLLRKICLKPSVGSVILVESSKELMEWYGYELCRDLPKIDDIIIGDAYDEVGKHGGKTRYIYDLWQGYGQAKTDDRWQQAQELAEYTWAWGDLKV